jgi:RIO kinase 1
MSNKNAIEWFYELDDSTEDKPMPLRMQRLQAKRWPKHPEARIAEQQEGHHEFMFTYKAARFEAGWLLDSLGSFYHNGWIEDVLRIVKGGKEASVYLCRAVENVVPLTRNQDGLVAAKVYRPRSMRNLRNDAIYREGRTNVDVEGVVVRDERMDKAMRQKTRYGQELLHESWIGYEFLSLQNLHAAGVDVPRPYISDSNAILMDYIGEEGMPAPALSDVRLDTDEVKPLFERVMRNIELMLKSERIHGDLSAYNILYWDGEIMLIDFPQAIHPDQNRNAYRIFERDVVRVCEYFAHQPRVHWGSGVQHVSPLHPRKLAADIWTAHRYPIQPQVDVRLLDAEDEKDVAFWKKAAGAD